MKLLYKILAAAAGILALNSCVEEAIAPLTGKYEKPVTYEMNNLVSQSVEKGERTRTFTVEISNSEASLNMKFIGDKYFLHDAGFTAATADAAKKGNYIVGNDGSTFTLNGTNVNIDSGTLVVKQGEGTYTFSGILWLADESIIEIKSTVDLVYEPDPEPVKLTNVISATSNLANGVNSLTINLATDGVTATYNPNTWSNVYSGTGNYLAIDIYSEDGYLHEGTYTACATGGVINPGEFGIGYDTEMWGMQFYNWGTCWWDVNNGVVSINQKVLEGTVTVTWKNNKWNIELVSGEGKSMLWTTFSGAIEAVTDPAMLGGGSVDDTEYVELVNLISATSNVANGTPSLTINMAEDGISSTTDANWQTVWEGEGHYLALDIYSEDGKLYTGTYNANTVGGTINAGEFGIGWDPGDLWGIGMVFENWGTCWWAVADGAAVAEGKVTDGTVQVLVEGTNLVIKLKSTLVNAKFTYPAADFPIEVVNLGGGDEPEFEGTELSVLLSATSNVTSGTNSVTINMAEEGISSTTDANWQTVWEGEGHYLALDVYSADGKLAPGTYTACATGGTIAEGEFGIGWDPGDLWGIGMVFENWGTCWWNVSGGAATAEAKVLDGTLTVAVDGETYTITLESSAVNARYVGALTL